MISVQGVTKQYATRVLFDDVTFSIHEKERVGLVGRNGHGKTTLFRIMTGEEHADHGEVIVPRGYRVGYLPQDIRFSKETVLAEAALGLPEEEKDALWKVEPILMGLGFSVDDFMRPLASFSGGYQMRVVLTKTLVAEPDLLLLDEPTNFLDIVSIRWLERFLSSWRGELIVISHDRRFMDKIVTHVMGIHRRKLRKYAGKTAQYYGIIAQNEEVYEKERVSQEKKVKHMREFISKFRAKARHANLAQSRMKTLKKIEPKVRLAHIEELSFSFPYKEIPPKAMLRVDTLSFSYSGSTPYLIDALSFDIDAGDVVCVIGKNGKGKTTLVKLLAGELAPCQGTVKPHPQCAVAYYEQGHASLLNPDFTIEEELLAVADTGEAKRVRAVCGGLMFSGDDARKKNSVLSGGEKCRVMLGKLLVSQHNLLLLDEPTHHLDIEACDAIIEAVQNFEGAAIIVTHDERFLDAVATKLIVFKETRVEVFPGTYKEFMEQIGWDEADAATENDVSPAKPKKLSDKHAKAVFINERSRTLKPLQTRIEALEADIREKEERMKECNVGLVNASHEGHREAIAQFAKELHELKQSIDARYEDLFRTTDEYEKCRTDFEEREQEFA